MKDGTWIGESVRFIRTGSFNNNIAKSNNEYGFSFTHHESGEEVLLKGIKSMKNRHRGLYFYASHNVTIEDGIFSDNRYFGIEIHWSHKVQIKNTIIRGHTEKMKALTKPPIFLKTCDWEDAPAIGLLIPTAIWKLDQRENIGAILTNVHFTDFDHTDECETSFPISLTTDDPSRKHFDYLTMFRNVTINGTKIIKAPPSNGDDVKDIVIHDVDGSADPLGLSSESGMFVSDVKWLKDFAGGSCTSYPSDISYCTNSCYRTILFEIDQTISEQFELVVTRKVDGRRSVVPSIYYRYEDDDDLKHYFEHTRYFSVSLPEGSYDLEFMEDLKPVWPGFVFMWPERAPECEGYVSITNVTVYEPPAKCEDWIMNGDMELGLSNWAYGNGAKLTAVDGAGINNSTALRVSNRENRYSFVGQNLDTRCLHQSLGEYYEIQLYFRLENNTLPFICDPFTDAYETRCPYITFRKQKFINEELKSWWIGESSSISINRTTFSTLLLHMLGFVLFKSSSHFEITL